MKKICEVWKHIGKTIKIKVINNNFQGRKQIARVYPYFWSCFKLSISLFLYYFRTMFATGFWAVRYWVLTQAECIWLKMNLVMLLLLCCYLVFVMVMFLLYFWLMCCCSIVSLCCFSCCHVVIVMLLCSCDVLVM